MTAPLKTASDIIDFWFRDDTTGQLDLPQSKRWFQGGETLDQELEEQFLPTLNAAANGQLNHFLETATGTLGYIVLLDQFNRNIFRGTAEAFAMDSLALAACYHAIANGFHKQLPITQRVFCYLPLEHDESLVSQHLSITMYKELCDDAPESLKKFAQNTLDYALQHQKIIQQFGRYPYRNDVLGRHTTTDEARWMRESETRFGQ